MKVILLLTCIYSLYLTRLVAASAIKAPLEVLSLDDITPEERKELDYLHQKYGRPKRSGSGSGSGDILESLKLAIGQGIKNKIGELAKSSAAATARLSSGSSSSSSGHGYSYHHSPHPPESYDHKSLDFWSLKKSILNTLLQAVKAIKGGVIAVKGQLIKGSGYLTAGAGKLIVAKGDAVTNLGKKIASSAVLVPYNGHPSSHAEYGPPPESHYSAPSAPEDFYHGAPSAPAPEFHGSDHHYPYHDDETSHKGPSGLLILKKIHGDHYHHDHHHVAEESKIPSFKPIEPSGPSFGTIVGKFFSASSSLDPHKPEPFGHTATGDIHSYHSHSDSDHHYDASETKNHHDVAPSASGYVVNDEPAPVKEVSIKEPSDDSPFEKKPSYLNHNFDEHVASPSKNKPQTVKTNSIPQQEQKPSTFQSNNHPEVSASSQAFVQNGFNYPSVNVQTLGTAQSSNVNSGYDLYNLPHINNYQAGFPSSSEGLVMLQPANGELAAGLLSQTSTGQNIYYPSQSSSIIDFTQNYVQPTFGNSAENLIGPPQFSNELPNYYNPPQAQNHNSQNIKQHPPAPTPHVHRRPTRLTHYESAPSSSKHRTKSTHTKYPSSVTHKRPSSGTRTTTSKRKPNKHTYDVVKSISYELGPNGPKRLT